MSDEAALPTWVPLAFFFSGFAALIYDRLAELSEELPSTVQSAILRGPGLRLRNPGLVAWLAVLTLCHELGHAELGSGELRRRVAGTVPVGRDTAPRQFPPGDKKRGHGAPPALPTLLMG